MNLSLGHVMSHTKWGRIGSIVLTFILQTDKMTYRQEKYISIYKFGLSVCLFVSNKRQNGWTDRAQIFCGTSHDHRKGLWMIKISNICLHQNSIFIKFLKILKIHEIFCENPRIIYVLFYDVHKENMFTINLEDGREAPSKASSIEIPTLNIWKNWKFSRSKYVLPNQVI